MVGKPDRKSLKQSASGLRRLADAYDVSIPTLQAIADAIITRTELMDGEYQRSAVMDLIAFIIEDGEALTVLEKRGKLPDDVVSRMAELIASDPPATVPEWDLMQTVLNDMRFVLSRARPQDRVE